ncbi:integrase [Tersicoccus phoenicis]|uniref:Integrase n=1 Tax=Tersicoccus phoenicis TaxID=554083 RepID=A0A1R1LKY2_9MICC|nr:Mu transposase C-terminal domain-containing protein [Tersicoccus phoenicis]OMH28183.1 integrase [Tersicoccus phoenicis]
MRSVRLFDFISYDADTFQVVAQDGAKLALKSMTTNRIRHVGVAELLGDDSYEPDAADRLPVLDNISVLDSLDQQTRDEALWLYRHVHEIVHGTPPLALFGDTEISLNPDYDQSLPLLQRVSAKANELATSDRPVSARSLRRHVYAYRKEGVAGLVDGRKRRQRNPGREQDARLLDLIKEEIAAQETVSTGTRTRVITRVTVKAKAQGIEVPSKNTMYRLIAAQEKDRHPFGDATLRRTQANRPDRAYGRRSPLRPGELVEIDSTKLDLMVVFPDGTTGRPELTTMIDVATMTPTAAMLFPEATKGIDVAALVLARSLTPLPMQPGWNEELALSRSVLPAGMIEPDETLRAGIAARPLIYPETITIDRGRVYTGSVFQMACERLQISVIPAPPGTPTAKPHIERQFGAVHDGLIQYLRGYVGRSVSRRGEDPSKEAYWTISQVQSLLDQWLVQEWQTKPRKGLTVAAMPKQALSPNEMYAALSGIAPTPAVALTRDDYISLLPMDFRSIQPYGVNYSGIVYDDPALLPLRGQRSGLGGRAKDGWEVRYDPARMNMIFVRDHRQGRWIEAHWQLDDKALAPFSSAVLEAARRAVAKRDSTMPQHKVLEEIIRIQSGLDVSGHERLAARRRTEPSVPALAVMDDDGDREISEPPEAPATKRRTLPDLPDRLL